MNRQHYGLFTVISLIVGTVIGSGIFFKSDNILVATGGSVGRGILVFCLAAFAIVFGCLSVSELAKRTDRPGGVVAYADVFINRRMSAAFGWFFGLVYYPTLGVVVSWVVGIYACILFGWEGTLERQMAIGAAFLLVCTGYNLVSARFAGLFQRVATVVKLLPLFLIALAGLLFGDPQAASAPQLAEGVRSLGWLSAIGPIAFAFDGWVVATAISGELKNPRRNLPLALIISPLFILAIYVAYFSGISRMIGPDRILELGDGHVNLAAEQLLGAFGAKILLACVLISVMGTVNGLVIAGIRTPNALAQEKAFPFATALAGTHPKTGLSIASGVFFLGLSLLWYGAHYLTMRFNILPNSDISEISIVVQYLLYILLYVQVFRLAAKGEIRSRFFGWVAPALAIVGSLIILAGGLQNPLAPFYALFCLVFLIGGYLYAGRNAATP